jgi:sugar phosphate isomerase/epimerase
MEIYLSTTSIGVKNTSLIDVLGEIRGLDIDGIELGSTHKWEHGLIDVAKSVTNKKLTHNYFPPSKIEFVLNIASSDEEVRKNSIKHIKYCIDSSAEIGSDLYTFHPGFRAGSALPSNFYSKEQAYDFNFSQKISTYEKSFEQLINSLSEIVSYAKKKSIKIAIETEGSLSNPNMLMMERPEEYREVFSIFKEDLFLNFNIAHSNFASKYHSYNLQKFIEEFYSKIVAVEISENDGIKDQHLPISSRDSYIFIWLKLLPKVPYILEFRNANKNEIQKSISLIRSSYI